MWQWWNSDWRELFEWFVLCGRHVPAVGRFPRWLLFNGLHGGQRIKLSFGLSLHRRRERRSIRITDIRVVLPDLHFEYRLQTGLRLS